MTASSCFVTAPREPVCIPHRCRRAIMRCTLGRSRSIRSPVLPSSMDSSRPATAMVCGVKEIRDCMGFTNDCLAEISSRSLPSCIGVGVHVSPVDHRIGCTGYSVNRRVGFSSVRNETASTEQVCAVSLHPTRHVRANAARCRRSVVDPRHLTGAARRALARLPT